MKFRIVEIECPESRSGRCCVLEKKTLFFGWKPCLTTYDYGGSEIAEHFPNADDAKRAFDRQIAGLTKVVRSSVVVDQWEY